MIKYLLTFFLIATVAFAGGGGPNSNVIQFVNGGTATNVSSTFPLPVNATVSATFSNPSSGFPGSTVPSQATYIGGNKGGVLTGVLLDSSGNLQVSLQGALPPGSSTIGAVSQAGIWTVQPGNTPNTVAWKVDGSSTVQPTSMTGANAPVNPTGSFVQSSVIGSSGASTISVPSHAVGFICEASSSNANNLRYAIGSTASTTSGMRLEPGRDTGYIPLAANISVEAEAGSAQQIQCQWVVNQ